MSIQKIFELVAKKYHVEDLFTMLENNSMPVSFLMINNDNKIQGEQLVDDHLMKDATQRPLNGIQAYYLDGKVPERLSRNPIFALRENHLQRSDELTELLVVHELAHAIEKQGLENQLLVTLSDCDVIIGREIEKIANEVYDQTVGFGKDIDHNCKFGAILSSLIRRQFPQAHPKKLSDALQYNLLDDYSSRFVCE